MSINQMIAQGIQPIGRDLPQVANMLYQRDRDVQQDARRNELLRIEQEQEARRNSMLNEKMGWEREDRGVAAQERERAQAAEHMKIIRPLIAAGDPRAIEEAINGIAKHSPEAAELIRGNPEKLLEVIDGVIGKGQAPGQLYRTEKGYLPADQAIGMMPYEDQPAGPSPLEYQRERRERAESRFDAAKQTHELKKEEDLQAVIKALTLAPNDPRAPQFKARYRAYTGKDWDAEQRKGKDPWGDEGAVDSQEGQTGTSKSGKPIIFRNGRWEYQ